MTDLKAALAWLAIAITLGIGYLAYTKNWLEPESKASIILEPRTPTITSFALSPTETFKTITIPDRALSDVPELDRLCFLYENSARGVSHMQCLPAL